jgi:hypothetical protein
MDLDELGTALSDMGRQWGMTDLELDEYGDASLLVQGDMEVFLHFDEVSQSLIVESLLADLGTAPKEETLERLLRANRLGVETLGGTLALGPKDEIMLMRAVATATLNQASLERALVCQANAIRSLKALFSAADPSGFAVQITSTIALDSQDIPLDPRRFA